METRGWELTRWMVCKSYGDSGCEVMLIAANHALMKVPRMWWGDPQSDTGAGDWGPVNVVIGDNPTIMSDGMDEWLRSVLEVHPEDV